MLAFAIELQIMQEWKHYVSEWNQMSFIVIPFCIYQVAELRVGNRRGKNLMPLASISFHTVNKDFKSFTQRQGIHQWITFRELSRAPTALFSFIIRTVSIFLQVQTTCRWYSTPANYRARFKDSLIYSCAFPPPPRQTVRRPRQPWCSALLFSFSCLTADVIRSIDILSLLSTSSELVLHSFTSKVGAENYVTPELKTFHYNLENWKEKSFCSRLVSHY